MAFANDLANAGTFGLAGLALGKKKKPPVVTPPAPSMIMSPTSSRPTSMIGGGRY